MKIKNKIKIVGAGVAVAGTMAVALLTGGCTENVIQPQECKVCENNTDTIRVYDTLVVKDTIRDTIDIGFTPEERLAMKKSRIDSTLRAHIAHCVANHGQQHKDEVIEEHEYWNSSNAFTLSQLKMDMRRKHLECVLGKVAENDVDMINNVTNKNMGISFWGITKQDSTSGLISEFKVEELQVGNIVCDFRNKVERPPNDTVGFMWSPYIKWQTILNHSQNSPYYSTGYAAPSTFDYPDKNNQQSFVAMHTLKVKHDDIEVRECN